MPFAGRKSPEKTNAVPDAREMSGTSTMVPLGAFTRVFGIAASAACQPCCVEGAANRAGDVAPFTASPAALTVGGTAPAGSAFCTAYKAAFWSWAESTADWIMDGEERTRGVLRSTRFASSISTWEVSGRESIFCWKASVVRTRRSGLSCVTAMRSSLRASVVDPARAPGWKESRTGSTVTICCDCFSPASGAR